MSLVSLDLFLPLLQEVDPAWLLGIPLLLTGSLAASSSGELRNLSKLEAIEKITALIHDGADLAGVLDRSLQYLIGLTGLDSGLFILCSSAGQPDTIQAHRGLAAETLYCIGRDPGSDAVIRKALLRGKPVIIPDLAASRYESPIAHCLQEAQMRTGAFYPIGARGRAVGVLCLAAGRPQRLTRARNRLVQTLLQVVALAIRDSRTLDQSRKLSEDLVTLQEMNKIISQSLNLDEIIRRIVVEGKRLVKTDECNLFLLDDRTQCLIGAASTDTDRDISSLQIAVDEPSHLTTSFRKKRVLAVGDLLQDPGTNRRLIEVMKWRAAIYAPLLTKDQAVGILVLSDRTPGRSFAPEEMVRAETLAHQAAIAMENARLFQVVSRSQKEWETTFDAMQDCVSVHDMTGKVIRANLALARRINATPAGVIGKYCSELYTSHGTSFIPCRHTRALQSESLTVEEVDLPIMGGTFQIAVSPWHDKNNRLAGSIHVAKDTSNEKHLQRQLIQSEKLSAIGELISGIAHELNNPLTGVMGYSQLLQLRKDLDQTTKDSLAKINSLALRCQKIVQNLLSFARKQKPERIVTDLNEILERTLELRAYEFEVNNIEIVRDFDPNLPKTVADAHQLQQVFLNLLTNSEHAMLEAHGSGTVHVRTRTDERNANIRIEIIDDGPGIPESQLSRVFDPFFTTKEVGKGTGLGLSLSYGIIREHDGKIYARSQVGEGSSFIVELPIVSRLQGELSIAYTRAEHAEFEELVRDKRILVVDDEKYILDFFTEVFKMYPLRVETAGNGMAAVEKIQVADYDVIITDFKMPKMSGSELFHWVKSYRPHLARRMIFVTGDTLSTETRDFFERNRNPFLAKPFKIEEVKEAIRHSFSISD